MVDLFVDKVGYVERSVHQICAKVLRRVVGAELEAKCAKLFERTTGAVGEIADDGFGCGIVPAPMAIPVGEAAVAVRVIAAE